MGNNNFWTSVPCRGEDVDAIPLGDPSNEEDEAGLVQEVSLAKKRKIVQQGKEKRNTKKKATNFTRDEAVCRRVQDVIGTRRTLATVTRACTCRTQSAQKSSCLLRLRIRALRHLWKHSGMWKQEPHARKRVQEKIASKEAGCNEENAQWQKPTRCGSMA